MNEAKIDKKKKIIIKECLLRNNGFLMVLNDLSKPIDKRINEITWNYQEINLDTKIMSTSLLEIYNLNNKLIN